MSSILVKKGQDRRERMRVAHLTRRVVGLYRLMDEQMETEKFNSISEYVANDLSKSRWYRFRDILHKNLKNDLLNEEKMSELVAVKHRDTGSLRDMVITKKEGFSEHALLIRIGNLMEKSIKEFMYSTYTSYDKELTDGIIANAGYNIQRDLSVKKDTKVVIAELKYNLNLDTEKSKALVDKLDLLNVACKDTLKNSGLTPIICMVSLRYPATRDIPKLKPVLEGVRTQYIIGYTQLFQFFGVKVTKAMWDNLHRTIGKEVDSYFEEFSRRNG